MLQLTSGAVISSNRHFSCTPIRIMVLTFEQAAHCTLSTSVSKFTPKKAGENLGKIITQKSFFHKKICSPERIRDQIAQTVRNI